MKKIFNSKNLTILIVIAIAIYVLVAYVQKDQNRKIVNSLGDEVSSQDAKLVNFANLTRSNSGDEITTKVLIDCEIEDRKQFDSLLDKLSSSISSVELNTLNNLFTKCGSYDSDQKTFMAVTFAREVANYKHLLDFKNNFFVTSDSEKTRLTSWQNLAQAELQLAQYFNTLVDLQGQIITLLISGKTSTSDEVKAILTEVNATKGRMIVLNKQIETLRKDELHI